MTADREALQEYLSQFAEPDGYLNFARYGPPSRRVVRTVTDMLTSSSEPTVGTMEGLRAQERRPIPTLARLLGVGEADVCLVPNTSTGLFHTALGLPAGTVAVSPSEFPANVYPWRRAEGLGRIRVRPIATSAGRVTPDSVRAALDPGTVAVSVSAVDFRTGYRADLAALRDVVGDRILVVDAIQAFGVVDMPWDAADVVVAGGQKWLRASWSTGFLSVSPRVAERLEPVLTGWTGVQDQAVFDDVLHEPKPGAGRFAITHASPVAAAALAEAVELVESVGVRTVETRISATVDAVLAVVDAHGGVVLSPTEPARRAGIVAFRLPGIAPDRLAAALTACGVVATVRGDLVRLSPHATTTEATTAMLADALAETRRRTPARAEALR